MTSDNDYCTRSRMRSERGGMVMDLRRDRHFAAKAARVEPDAGLPHEVGRFVQPRQLARVPDEVDAGDPPVLYDEAHRGGLAGDLDAAHGRAVEPYGRR